MRGETVGGYRIEREIGRGGQAVVYRAMRVDFGQVVAVKVLTPGSEADCDSRARFEREATSVATLKHPHVLPIYEAGEDAGRCFIAMKYVAGGVLADRLRRDGALPVGEALELLGQLASALDHAHAEGVVHRDIKPANVLLGGNRHVYLADFGLSRHAHAPVLTPVGAWIGTPEYVAPEVLRGQEPSAASDRYALALLAYEALTGQIAFPRSTPAAIIYSHLNDPPPHAFEARPELGRKASSELAKGMDKRPGRRPGSSVELIERLSAAIDATPGALAAAAPAARPVAPERFMSTRLAATLGPGDDSREPRRVRRLRSRRVAVAGLAIAAVAGLAVGVRGVGGPLPGGSGPAGEAPIAAAGISPLPPDPVAEVSEPPPAEPRARGGRRDRADVGDTARPPRGQPDDGRPRDRPPPRGRRA